eukprot:Awhi_evm1s12575
MDKINYWDSHCHVGIEKDHVKEINNDVKKSNLVLMSTQEDDWISVAKASQECKGSVPCFAFSRCLKLPLDSNSIGRICTWTSVDHDYISRLIPIVL